MKSELREVGADTNFIGRIPVTRSGVRVFFGSQYERFTGGGNWGICVQCGRIGGKNYYSLCGPPTRCCRGME